MEIFLTAAALKIRKVLAVASAHSKPITRPQQFDLTGLPTVLRTPWRQSTAPTQRRTFAL
jgi:hypothetical protein